MLPSSSTPLTDAEIERNVALRLEREAARSRFETNLGSIYARQEYIKTRRERTLPLQRDSFTALQEPWDPNQRINTNYQSVVYNALNTEIGDPFEVTTGENTLIENTHTIGTNEDQCDYFAQQWRNLVRNEEKFNQTITNLNNLSDSQLELFWNALRKKDIEDSNEDKRSAADNTFLAAHSHMSIRAGKELRVDTTPMTYTEDIVLTKFASQQEHQNLGIKAKKTFLIKAISDHYYYNVAHKLEHDTYILTDICKVSPDLLTQAKNLPNPNAIRSLNNVVNPYLTRINQLSAQDKQKARKLFNDKNIHRLQKYVDNKVSGVFDSHSNVGSSHTMAMGKVNGTYVIFNNTPLRREVRDAYPHLAAYFVDKKKVDLKYLPGIQAAKNNPHCGWAAHFTLNALRRYQSDFKTGVTPEQISDALIKIDISEFVEELEKEILKGLQIINTERMQKCEEPIFYYSLARQRDDYEQGSTFVRGDIVQALEKIGKLEELQRKFNSIYSRVEEVLQADKLVDQISNPITGIRNTDIESQTTGIAMESIRTPTESSHILDSISPLSTDQNPLRHSYASEERLDLESSTLNNSRSNSSIAPLKSNPSINTNELNTLMLKANIGDKFLTTQKIELGYQQLKQQNTINKRDKLDFPARQSAYKAILSSQNPPGEVVIKMEAMKLFCKDIEFKYSKSRNSYKVNKLIDILNNALTEGDYNVLKRVFPNSTRIDEIKNDKQEMIYGIQSVITTLKTLSNTSLKR